jgi:hypothetical protein
MAVGGRGVGGIGSIGAFKTALGGVTAAKMERTAERQVGIVGRGTKRSALMQEFEPAKRLRDVSRAFREAIASLSPKAK